MQYGFLCAILLLRVISSRLIICCCRFHSSTLPFLFVCLLFFYSIMLLSFLFTYCFIVHCILFFKLSVSYFITLTSAFIISPYLLLYYHLCSSYVPHFITKSSALVIFVHLLHYLPSVCYVSYHYYYITIP